MVPASGVPVGTSQKLLLPVRVLQVHVSAPVRVSVQVPVLQAQRVWASALQAPELQMQPGSPPVRVLPESPREQQEPGLRERPQQGLQALPGRPVSLPGPLQESELRERPAPPSQRSELP